MTEGEVMEQIVGYMSLLLLGVSIIFTVVSTYIVALNYFVGEAQLVARVGAFAFVSLILLPLIGLVAWIAINLASTKRAFIELERFDAVVLKRCDPVLMANAERRKRRAQPVGALVQLQERELP